MLPKSIRFPFVIALSAVLAPVAACSSSSSSQAPDASADGSPTMPFACGTATCSAGQWCVQPCSCGGLAACEPTDDAGACPTGSTLQQCGAADHMGCIVTCTNPPPSCQGSIPGACYDQGGGMVRCACPG